jgi:hypothetical protein
LFTSIIFEHFLVLVDWTNSPQIKMSLQSEGRRGHDQMVVGFKATYVISDYHHWRCELVVGLWCLTSFQQYFSNIVEVSFIGGGNLSTWRKPLNCHKSLTNFNELLPSICPNLPQLTFHIMFAEWARMFLFSFFVVVLLCVFTLSVPCCDVRYDFRIKTMTSCSSLPPVVCRRIVSFLTLFMFVYNISVISWR